MFNLISLLIGFVTLILVAIAFIPFLGIANWVILPVAILGAGIGLLGRSKAGLVLNLIVIAIGVVRLSLGGGIL